MEMDQGKLFIGGISWDTNEDRLTEYFRAYGEVVEAVIMRDKTTGRARGFGFVVFSNPADAERVVKEKHMIDGRTVEAKKALPRDDQHLVNRNSIQGSPGRTKKIFVGGLASTVTENDFKTYFDQFGTVLDVVVMYDHNTQRPRGFGFITYDSEDAVDRVLHKTFHELNSKMVEVKRAVPKELSPGPARVPLVGSNFGFNRPNNFLNSYAHGYNMTAVGGYGIRMDSRYSPMADGHVAGFSHFGSPTYGEGLNMEQGLNAGSVGSSNFSTNLGYSSVMSPYFGSRYNTPIGVNASDSRGGNFPNSASRNVWGNGNGEHNNSANNAGSTSYFGLVSGGFGVFGNNGANGGTSPIRSSSGYNNFGNRGRENSYGLGMGGGFGRSNTAGATASSFSASGGDFVGSYPDIYRSGSVYGDPTWQNTSSELDNSGTGTFGYGPGNSEDVAAKYFDNYGIVNRQPSRRIATQEVSALGR